MDVLQTDSGYPTPRGEELLSSPRSLSPITPTPVEQQQPQVSEEQKATIIRFIKPYLEMISEMKRLKCENETLRKESQNEQQQPQVSEEQNARIIRIIKPYLEMISEMKRVKRENETLREESMRSGNTSFELGDTFDYRPV